MFCRLKFDIYWKDLIWACVGFTRPQQSPSLFHKHHQLSNNTITPSLSVRTAFDAILSELPKHYGNKILMTAINIEDMRAIAITHGYEVIAVEIDPATMSPPPNALLNAQQSCGAKICLIAHLFGATNLITDAKTLRAMGVFIIEDAAQSFAGKLHMGDSYADCSLFSFGPIKRYTALGGALAVFNKTHSKLAAKVENRLASYTKRTEIWFRKRAFKYLILKFLIQPIIYTLLVSSISKSGKNVDETISGFARGFSGQPLIEAIRYQPPNRLLTLLNCQLNRAFCDEAAEKKRRSICQDFLSKLPIEQALLGNAAQKHGYWLLPLMVKDPKTAMKSLRDNGFDATRGSTSLRALNCAEAPNATQILDSIIYVPNPAELKPSTRIKLIEQIKKLPV